MTRAANDDCINGGSCNRTKYGYDAAGHTQGYGTNGFTYNNRGRMAATSASSTDYLYNALGQMIEKSGTLGTTTFMQDEAGHLIGEYDGSGNLIEETIWLGDTPVATLQPNGSGGVNIFYVHTDHLNAPRKVQQPVTDTLVWRWDTDPFGTAAPNVDPAGYGTFPYNIRFPGQIYMAETGLNYNYARDYDPETGRYIESDPAGLRGGVNTYAYASEAPVSIADTLGLQGFNPGTPPPDPTPEGRDPRTPWLPPNLPAKGVCDPYWRINTELDGFAYNGLIPLVSEELISQDGCKKTYKCIYRGVIAAGVDFDLKTAHWTEWETTTYKTVQK